MTKIFIFSEIFPEGVSPWALLRLAGGGNVSNFEKLNFLFFSDPDSFGSKKSSKKKIFEIRKFQCFTVSVFHCFSQFLLLDYLRIYHVFDISPSPQKPCFFPQFSTSNISEDFTFFEIVPRGKKFPWYLKINFYDGGQPSPALPGRGRARRMRGPDFSPAPLISPKISKIETWD